MAAIDHNSRRYAGFRHTLGRCIDVFCIVIGITTSSQNDMAILVACGGDDRRMTVLGYGEKMMRSLRGADGIDGNADVAVSAVFETYGTG